jgi:large conductance mechanosensitive channel
MSGFKNFIMRGNLVELAVAVVIGTQFSNLVKQFVSSFVNPLLSLVGGTPNFGNLTFKVGEAIFSCGQVVTAALSFLISALVVYFILVLPVSRLLQLLERNKAATTRDCPECMMSLPVAARSARPRSLRPPSSPSRSVSPAGGLAGRVSVRWVYRFPPGPRWPARPDGPPSRRPGARIRR